MQTRLAVEKKTIKSKNMYTNNPKWSHKEMQHISKIKIKNQHNTDDGGQAMGEVMRHVQMSRRGKHTGEESKQQ